MSKKLSKDNFLDVKLEESKGDEANNNFSRGIQGK